jgi:serine/threonine protein phosphatase PrpC
MKNLIYYGSTHTGKQRKENQDAFGAVKLWADTRALLLVADGVGGYAGGERAAAIAKASIEKYMRTPKGDTLTMLKEAAIYANNQILEERKSNPQLFEMCCVFTAIVADAKENQLHFVHVGDTRLYRYRNGVLQKLTRDHSFVGIREDAGEISEKEAMDHPQRNQILREAGSMLHRIDDEDWMDSGTRDFNYDDVLLICSDGLTDMLTSAQITAVLQADLALRDKVKQLVDMANEMGGFDNITVVLARHKNKAQSKPLVTDTSEDTAVPLTENKKLSQSRSRRWFSTKMILRVVLLFIFLAGTSWYFYSLKPNVVNGTFISADGEAQTLPHSEIRVRDSLKENLLYTMKSANPATPGPVQPKLTDTVTIEATKSFYEMQKIADSSGKNILLRPGKKNPAYPALEIKPGSNSPDTVFIRNFHFRDFENAIFINTPAAVVLQNTTFENIRNPISYGKLSGPGNKSLIITSNSQ